MKGVRFYAEYDDGKHRRRDTVGSRSKLAATPTPAKNVIAVYLGDDGRPLWGGDSMDCAGAIFHEPNSDVAGTGVSYEVLRERCRRISEAEARRIHPRMFEYLRD